MARLRGSTKGPKLFEDFFVFFWNSFCFCAFAWSEGTGKRDGGREEGGFFPPIPSHFCILGFPQENVRYLGFPRETTVFLTFWTDFVPFPTFPDENLRLVVVVVVLRKTDITLVVVVAVVVVVVAVIVLLVVCC